MVSGLCGFSDEPFEDLKEYNRALKFAEERYEHSKKAVILKEERIADALNMNYIDWDDYGCSFCRIDSKYGVVNIYSQNSGAFSSLLSDLELEKDLLLNGNPRKKIKPDYEFAKKYKPILAVIGDDYFKITVQHEILKPIVLRGLGDSIDAIKEMKDEDDCLLDEEEFLRETNHIPCINCTIEYEECSGTEKCVFYNEG
jgi:hypothetical protein